MAFAEVKVGVVIGGARGIGKVTVKALLQNKAKVVVGDVREDVGTKTASDLQKAFPGCIVFKTCDISSEKDIRALFELAQSTFGRVDMLINFAGMDDELWQWEQTIATNFTGVVRSSYVALDYMSTENGGSGGIILHTASLAAFLLGKCNPVYHATKHAVLAFVLSFGDKAHLQRTGVRFNCICPCVVKTDWYADTKVFFQSEYDAWINKNQGVPPEQCAEAVISLIKDESLNGEAMIVSPRKGNFLYDKAREIEYVTLL